MEWKQFVLGLFCVDQSYTPADVERMLRHSQPPLRDSLEPPICLICCLRDGMTVGENGPCSTDHLRSCLARKRTIMRIFAKRSAVDK